MKIHNIKIKWTGNRELGEKRYTILTLIHLFKIMDDGSYQVADIQITLSIFLKDWCYF